MSSALRAPARRSAGRVIAYALFAYALLAICLVAVASAGVVPTDRGPVRGIETAKVKEYLGIPYAAPPVGALRWQPPRPAARWNGPLAADHFGNHCPQPASPFGTASNTEDCLYLNVYTPNRGPGRGHAKNLPVMFWIHGGGLATGESDDYDPTRLVEQGNVVVTINYRLGWLGFLAHHDLSSASGYGGSGNYGLMDQQAALRWVQRNIAKFGGDRDNVTIFGQSAGGLSVHAQLASPLAAGLFDRAIAQSGAYALSQPSLADAENKGNTFALQAGCIERTLECLRSLPVETILASQPTVEGSVLPNTDGKLLTQTLRSSFETGQFNRVPVIEGTTHDEFSIFAALEIELKLGQLPPEFYSLIVGVLTQTVGLNKDPSAIVAEYPIARYGSNVGQALSAIGTDALFACPGRATAGLLSQYVPTHAYELNDPDVPQPFAPPVSFRYGSYHAADLLFLFDSRTFGSEFGGHAPFTPAEEQLAASMVSYWSQFARTGDPNSAREPQWPAYTTATDLYQSLEPPTPVTISDFAADHHCAFWNSN
jgi:para-nitrobenzyl esterase